MHRHSHSHSLKRQKWICPMADYCEHAMSVPNNIQCNHSIEHLENNGCHDLDDEKCPTCIKIQEVIEEETFISEKEFQL